MTRSTARSVHLGQYRLIRLQVANWGTFSGYKDFRIDERGVLLTGPSGCGKSSLMDAHSLALLPTHDQRFNASADLTARGARQGTRSVAAYVRGAWAETNDEQEQSKVRYLRGGKPTWSAVAATYDDGLGSVTTGVVVKWFTGVETDGASMKTMHQLHRGHFDLSELNAWAEREFDTRWFKKEFSAADYPTSQDAYLGELGRRVGLDRSGTALALLGKAKAMKNVGDLNLFIRDNMLDRPQTFEAARRMLAAFTPLYEAYSTAKRASEQERVLHDLPKNWQVYKTSGQRQDKAETLRGDTLVRYVRRLHVAAIEAELGVIDALVQELDAAIGGQQEKRDIARAELESLIGQLQKKNQGIALLEQRRDAQKSAASIARDRFDRYSGEITRLAEPVPQDEATFESLRARLPELGKVAKETLRKTEPDLHDAIGKRFETKREFEEKDRELKRLQVAKSLIPERAVRRRERIAEAARLPIADLPYAAELIDIAEGQERWRPAAEKVLRNYGMRLLVPESHKDAVRRFIDGNDMHGLVEYSVVTAVSAHEPPASGGTLASKLTVDQAHRHGRWLAGQLAKRFRHACVESAADLDQHGTAVTVHGTVKLPGNHYRKDDRPDLTNPASYILGANTVAKRRALETEVKILEETLALLTEQVRVLGVRVEEEKGRIRAAAEAAGVAAWSSVDHWTPTRVATDLQVQIDEIREGDLDLRRLEKQKDEAQTAYDNAFTVWRKTTERIEEESQRETRLVDLLQVEEGKPRALDPDDLAYLDEMGESNDLAVTLTDVEQVRRSLDAALRGRAMEADRDRKVAREKVSQAISRFLEEWRDHGLDDSGDVDRSGADFVKLHNEIVTRRLPDAMGRFQRMISDDMVPSIAQLQYTIDNAVREIKERIGWVNDGLARVEFNPGRHLQISYGANISAEVKEFRDHFEELIRHSATLKDDAAQYVAQFKRVKRLMAKFTADDPAAERWRRSVLDVRTGYTFYGREVDAAGMTVFTYRNTATNSGGEQEKLVAFCLAAALSYNLADSETGGRPKFGTLMLDEAFSKSDENFSAQALSAFDEFGFQLVIAAPIRMSGIVEPYIGQAILVEKRVFPDGARSTGKSATFGELAERRFAEDDGDARASA